MNPAKWACEWLSINSTQYNEKQMEMGLEFIKRQYSYSEELMEKLPKSPVFWNWWKYMWKNHEAQLMSDAKGIDYNIDERILLHDEAHTVTITPHGKVIKKALKTISNQPTK